MDEMLLAEAEALVATRRGVPGGNISQESGVEESGVGLGFERVGHRHRMPTSTISSLNRSDPNVTGEGERGEGDGPGPLTHATHLPGPLTQACETIAGVKISGSPLDQISTLVDALLSRMETVLLQGVHQEWKREEIKALKHVFILFLVTTILNWRRSKL